MPRLPPVPISPHTRLRARFWSAVIGSMLTFFQSHSSSSATSWSRPVCVPWPISERATRIAQLLSGFMTTQAFTSLPCAAFFASAANENGTLKPTARPPLTAAVCTMNLRREGLRSFEESFFMSRLLLSGGLVDRGADALVRAAAADVGHRFVDVLVGRVRVRLEERDRGHDLARLAVAAL